MATLEKIRSKSVLLIVIIGAALLAFIVGDALTNSRTLFGDGTTIAKAGGEKIDYTEYQQKREELNQQLENARRQNPEQYANFDTQILTQEAINQLINEHLLDAAVAKAGIQTSPEQLRFYIMESGMQNPDLATIMQQLQQAGVNAATPEQAYQVIFNPKPNGATEQQVAPFRNAWLSMEEGMKKNIKRQTYGRLLQGTIRANNLDKHAMHNDYVATTNIALAYKPFGQLSEKEYPVTDNEIQSAYDQKKAMFKVLEPSKEISFIAVNIQPSKNDIDAARQLASKTVAALSDSSSQKLNKDLKKAGLAIERREVRLSDISTGALKEFVATASPNAVKLVTENRNGFTVVRMGKRSLRLDSIQLNLVQVAGDKLPKRVLAALNNGLPADSVMAKFNPDSVMAQPKQWIPLYNEKGATQAIEEKQLDSLINASGRYIALMETPQGAVLAQVASQAASKEVVAFEQVVYDLKPSAATINAARTKLDKFLAANPTAEEFNKNAAKDGYIVHNIVISQSSPAVPRMGQNFYLDSRQVIRWAMIDGKTGEVSHIYESKDPMQPMLYAAAIDSEFDQFLPVSNKEVRDFLSAQIRADKAGDKLLKQYKPKATSVAAAAAAMNVEPNDNVQVRFGAGGAIQDPTVLGRINGEKPGKTIIMKGRDGIYVYQIKSRNKEAFPYNDEQFERQYMQQNSPDFSSMLRGSKKITNNAYKFEAGD